MSTDDGQDKCTMLPPQRTDDEDAPRDVPVLGRDAILEIDDRSRIPLPVPEWGGLIYVRMVSGGERDKFEASMRTVDGRARNLVDFRARFAVLVASDADGNALFTAADIPALTAKSSSALERILLAGMKLNRWTEQDIADLEKNSEGDRPDASGSD